MAFNEWRYKEIPNQKTSKIRLLFSKWFNIFFCNRFRYCSGIQNWPFRYYFKVEITDLERRRSYWKFTNTLLKDNKYIDEVKKIINEVKSMYVTNNENINVNEILDNDIMFNINDQLFLETL